MADETKNETVSDLADLKDIAGNAPEGDAAQIAETAQVPLREQELDKEGRAYATCLLYTSPSPRDLSTSRMPSSA